MSPSRIVSAVSILGVLVCVGACGGARRPVAADEPVALVDEGFTGIASYYHDSLHGNLTASGEPYDKRAFTAAHRTLPFGSRVRVTNLETGGSVVLRINDRGPFVDGRVIDVSRRAAETLGFIRAGLVRVRVQRTEEREGTR